MLSTKAVSFSRCSISPLFSASTLIRSALGRRWLPTVIYPPPTKDPTPPIGTTVGGTPPLRPQPFNDQLDPSVASLRLVQELMIFQFQPQHVKQVENLLLTSFLEHNRLGMAMGITAADFAEPIKDYAAAALKCGASYVAVEQRYGSVVGCAMLTIQERGAPPTEKLFDFHHYPPHVRAFMGFFRRFASNIFEHNPEIHKLAKLPIIYVEVNHRHGTVGRMLMEAVIDHARDQNCDAIVCDALSLKEQRLADNLGFVTLKTLDLRSYIDPINGDLPFANMPEENRYAKLLIKYLSGCYQNEVTPEAMLY